MGNRSEGRTYGFILISVLTHVALAAGIMVYKIQSDSKKKELADVEMVAGNSGSPAPKVAALETKEVESAPSAPVQASLPAHQAAEDNLPKKTTPTAKALPVKTPSSRPVAQKSAPKALPQAQHVTKTETPAVEESPTQDESPVAVSVSEEAQPEEKSQDVAAEAVKPEEPAKPEANSDEKVEAVQQDVSQEADKEVPEQNTQPEARLEKENDDKREAEAQALSAAAAERVARDAEEARKAEQAEAARQAEEARQAEKAKAEAIIAGKNPNADGEGAGNGSGTGNGQAAGAGTGVAGINNGDVRDLADLKQIPGNRRPLYDADDRLKGRQGQVSFLAYVSKEGALTQFKMLQSSGHRELDAKTLKALKTWKFYPGQEGWVEIPFKWDLQGGPQEMPATLRRAQVSQSQNN